MQVFVLGKLIKLVENIRVYLAHSVHQRTKGKEIQAKLEAMGFEVNNPFYPTDIRAARGDVEKLDKGIIVPWDIPDAKRGKFIIKIDLRAVMDADFIVCIYPNRRTVGIPCEMTFAWMVHLPVYCVVPEDMIGHPWIVGMSDRVFINMDDLYGYLADRYGKKEN